MPHSTLKQRNIAATNLFGTCYARQSGCLGTLGRAPKSRVPVDKFSRYARGKLAGASVDIVSFDHAVEGFAINSQQSRGRLLVPAGVV